MSTAGPAAGDAEKPSFFSSLDSLEGVPVWFEPTSAPSSGAPLLRTAHDVLSWAGAALPGVGLAGMLAFAGHLLSSLIGKSLGYEKSPVSPILVAVLLGLAIRNAVGVPKVYEPGLRLCVRAVLRAGIVLLGLGLSVQAVARIGLVALPIVACSITTALVAVTFVNRALGLPGRLGTLIAIGTSVCGVSAIVATAPVIEAEDDETSYAVACVTLFGLVALFSYPLVASVLFANDAQVGLFLGTAIHDTSQVAGAALSYAQQFAAKAAMETAVVVKLVRNLSMAVLIPLAALLHRRQAGAAGRRRAWTDAVPLFVLAFVAMACLRSIGDLGHPDGRAFGLVGRDEWQHFCRNVSGFAPWLLATAMAGVGAGTGISKLRVLGWKPFTVGFAAALLVGGASALLIKLLVP